MRPPTNFHASNIGNELVYVPVCIGSICTNPCHSCHLIHFMFRDLCYYLLYYSTYVLGKL